MAEPPAKSAQASGALSWPHLAAVLLPIILAVLYGLWAKHDYQNYYGRLDSHGVEAQATIIGKFTGDTGGSRSRPYYEIRFEFTVDGKRRRGRIRVTPGFYKSHDPPDKVAIRYLPEDPQIGEMDPRMRRKSRRDTYAIIAIFLFIGLANVFVLRGERRV